MRTLATIALLAALAGGLAACGDEPAPREDSAPASPEPEVPHEVLGIVNGVASGPAQVTTRPTYVGDRLALMRYLIRLGSDHVAGQVQDLVDGNEPADGMVEAAVVVSQGCDVPPGVEVTGTPRGVEVTPWKITDPHRECVVATTSVAVLELPAETFPDRGRRVPAD
jgi:hypothetical protein